MARVLILTGDATAACPRWASFVDGPMVSCRGWPDLPECSRAFMRVLEHSTVPV